MITLMRVGFLFFSECLLSVTHDFLSAIGKTNSQKDSLAAVGYMQIVLLAGLILAFGCRGTLVSLREIH